MAKKSAASLSIVPKAGSTEPEESEGLTPPELALWSRVIESKPAGWFGADSAPLLVEYVRAVSMCDLLDRRVRDAMEADDDDETVKRLLDMRDKESRRATTIATKLRLTQQSRYTPQAAATADKRASGRRPWQVGS